jgi:hypothetical protein
VVPPQVPQTLVQFLLVSGRRRSMAFDPETTVGRVKELVWNTWPSGTLSFTPAPSPYMNMRRACAIWFTKCAAPCRGYPTPFLPFIFIHSFFIIHFIEDRTLPILVDVWDFPFFP